MKVPADPVCAEETLSGLLIASLLILLQDPHKGGDPLSHVSFYKDTNPIHEDCILIT